MSDVFEQLGNLYDDLYRHKDYEDEVEYLTDVCAHYCDMSEPCSMLDLGCGTGKHASCLIRRGFDVTGIDSSETMLAAIPPNMRMQKHCGDIRDFSLNRKFKIIYSLFHVMSYMTTTEDVVSVFRSVNNHLEDGGLFVFDFWFTPAVYHQKPEVRVSRVNSSTKQILRVGEPSLDVSRSLCQIDYTFLVEGSRGFEVFKESHVMRHFTIGEIQSLASSCGFEMLRVEELVTGEVPSVETWALSAVFQLAGK